MNILIPIAGSSSFFSEDQYKYPKPLIEINGRPMIEWVIENLSQIRQLKQFIFVVNKKDCQRFHLDDVLRLLTKDKCQVIELDGNTQGACCSALMAIEHINNEEPLIISNGDQILNVDLDAAVKALQKPGCDGGVITFEAVHPKWSYVRLDEQGTIIETAEKRPISRQAIAGFYYFAKGSDFVMGAMSSIRKDASVDGLYFVAPVYNELVLAGRRCFSYEVDANAYHNFYTPQRIADFEQTGSRKLDGKKR